MMRKGMMKGSGKRGYHNIIGKDPLVHSQSAKGMKQPQRIPTARYNPYDQNIYESDKLKIISIGDNEIVFRNLRNNHITIKRIDTKTLSDKWKVGAVAEAGQGDLFISTMSHNQSKKYRIEADYGKPMVIEADSEEELFKELEDLESKAVDSPFMDVVIYDEQGNEVTDEAFKRFDSRKQPMEHGECIPHLKHGGDADTKFDQKQLAIGTKVETEHTNDKAIAKQIAKAHLVEDPKYYDKLKKVEGMGHKQESFPYGMSNTKDPVLIKGKDFYFVSDFWTTTRYPKTKEGLSEAKSHIKKNIEISKELKAERETNRYKGKAMV